MNHSPRNESKEHECSEVDLDAFCRLTGYSVDQVFELLEAGGLTCSPHHRKPTFSMGHVANHMPKEEGNDR